MHAAAKLATLETSRLLRRLQKPDTYPMISSSNDHFMILPSYDCQRTLLGVQDQTDRDPLVHAAAKLARLETSRLLRRLHKPDATQDRKAAMLPYQRHFAKLCRGHVIAVLDAAVQSVSFQITKSPAAISELVVQACMHAALPAPLCKALSGACHCCARCCCAVGEPLNHKFVLVT